MTVQTSSAGSLWSALRSSHACRNSFFVTLCVIPTLEIPRECKSISIQSYIYRRYAKGDQLVPKRIKLTQNVSVQTQPLISAPQLTGQLRARLARVTFKLWSCVLWRNLHYICLIQRLCSLLFIKHLWYNFYPFPFSFTSTLFSLRQSAWKRRGHRGGAGKQTLAAPGGEN